MCFLNKFFLVNPCYWTYTYIYADLDLRFLWFLPNETIFDLSCRIGGLLEFVQDLLTPFFINLHYIVQYWKTKSKANTNLISIAFIVLYFSNQAHLIMVNGALTFICYIWDMLTYFSSYPRPLKDTDIIEIKFFKEEEKVCTNKCVHHFKTILKSFIF